MESVRSYEMGYMALIAGLLDILEEANGVEVTEDMMYLNGRRRGEHIGKKLGADKDPHNAISEFIKYVRPYYDIEVIEEGDIKNGYMAQIRVNKCMIKEMCKNRGISIKNPLCRSTQGFIEGALGFMSGMQVAEYTSLVNWETCQGSVEFKRKRDILGILR